jgi:hypothetical protein
MKKTDKLIPHKLEALDKNLYQVSFFPDTIERHFVDVIVDGIVVSAGK